MRWLRSSHGKPVPIVFPVVTPCMRNSLSSKTTYIYALGCPITGMPRYIGKADNPIGRFRGHLLHAKTGRRSHKNNWLRSVQGPIPIYILEEVPKDDWEVAEITWISRGRHEFKWNLTNSTMGGEGGSEGDGPFFGKRHSAEARAKMSRAMSGVNVGKRRSAETRAKMSIAKIGNTTNLGRKPSAKTRVKMRASQRRRRRSESD